MDIKNLIISLAMGAVMIAGATAILIYAGPSGEEVERKLKDRRK